LPPPGFAAAAEDVMQDLFVALPAAPAVVPRSDLLACAHILLTSTSEYRIQPAQEAR
jgi:hypothetical protein